MYQLKVSAIARGNSGMRAAQRRFLLPGNRSQGNRFIDMSRVHVGV